MSEYTYDTPQVDDILQTDGWMKFEDHPIYFRKLSKQYMITFQVDFTSYQKLYEQHINEGKMHKEVVAVYLKTGFTKPAANHIVTNLTYEVLLMLTADFYHHQGDTDRHEKYKQQYEQLSGKKY
jgi:hypothetical protein